MSNRQRDQDRAGWRLMRVRRFAVAADMAPSTVYALVKSGALRGVRVGTALRIPASELERLERGEMVGA